MKVLIISLDKWGYNNFIAKELESKGSKVTHVDMFNHTYEYPSIFHKLFNFVSKNLFSYNLKREHLNKVILKKTNSLDKQDTTLIINGDNLSFNTLKTLKANTNNFVTFFNDSISRYPRLEAIIPYFDKVYSFDQNDIAKHKLKLATNYIYFDYENIILPKTKHNIFNISSLDKRNETLPQFASYFRSNNMSFKLIAFTSKKKGKLNNSGIEQTTNMYSLSNVFEIVKSSKMLLDLQRPKQKGLSFRVFEALALNKKLITTNVDIVNYDFYNPNNIFIVKDTNNINIPSSFFNSPYQKIDAKIVSSYHISSWVNNVFNL